MALLAVTVISRDRVGIIADVTGVLAQLGGNLQDSSMTLLHGHFAWTLLVEAEVGPEEVASRLRAAGLDGVAVSQVPADTAKGFESPERLIVAVHGEDRIGIVAAVSRVVADEGGNITELSTRLGQPRGGSGLYLAVAEVEFPRGVNVGRLQDRLRATCDELGLDVSVQRDEPDLM